MKTLSDSALFSLVSLDALLVVSHRELAPKLKRNSPLPRDSMVLSVFTPASTPKIQGQRAWARVVAQCPAPQR